MRMLASDLVPNLILWLVILTALWDAVRTAHPRFRILHYGALVLLFAASLPIGGRLLEYAWIPASTRIEQMPPGPGHAVMVFGAGMIADDHGNFWPSSNTLARGFAGAALARKLNLPLYISGGPTRGAGPSEASLLAEYLAFSGYPGSMEIDSSALDTWGNALAARMDRERMGWSGYIVVTDALHGRRALASLHALDVPVAGYVATRPLKPIGVQDFVPSVAGLLAWRGVGYEIAGSLHYMAKDRIDLDDVLLAGELQR